MNKDVDAVGRPCLQRRPSLLNQVAQTAKEKKEQQE